MQAIYESGGLKEKDKYQEHQYPATREKLAQLMEDEWGYKVNKYNSHYWYVLSENGETGIVLRKSELEFRIEKTTSRNGRKTEGEFVFPYHKCQIIEIRGDNNWLDCISICANGNKGVFLNIYNHK